MNLTAIIEEIKKLPLDKKLLVVEETIKSIKNDNTENPMEDAVNELHVAYESDNDLTAFTSLDLETFYETK